MHELSLLFSLSFARKKEKNKNDALERKSAFETHRPRLLKPSLPPFSPFRPFLLALLDGHDYSQHLGRDPQQRLWPDFLVCREEEPHRPR